MKLEIDRLQVENTTLNGKIEQLGINIHNAPGFLPRSSPEFLFTRTYNNNYDINYGYLSSCLNSDQSKILYATASKTNPQEGVARQITARRLRTAQLRRRQQGERGNTGGAAGGASVQPQLDPHRGGGDQSSQPEISPEDKQLAYNSTEVMRTVSSCMETPFWGTCTVEDHNLKCRMPNAKRTPDIVVAVVPENMTKYLRYAIITAEVKGSKDEGLEGNDWFDGMNASMQPLSLTHTTYYWEIGTNDVTIQKLEKVPEEGFIRVCEQTYDLFLKNEEGNYFPHMAKMVEDLCSIMLEGLINLAPLALMSAYNLTQAGYRDFINIPSMLRRKIEPHCWHIFVPENSWWLWLQHKSSFPT